MIFTSLILMINDIANTLLIEKALFYFSSMKGVYRAISWIAQWRKGLSQENRSLAVPSKFRSICLIICYTVEAAIPINQLLVAHIPI